MLITRATAPSDLLGGEREAVLEGRVSLAGADAFDLAGTVSFGMGDALRFRSVERGTIDASPEPGLSVGTAVCEIDGGSGRLAGASGQIATSFVLSETGELTDHQQGFVLVEAGAPR